MGKEREREKTSTWWGMTIRIDGRQLNCRARVSLQVGQVAQGSPAGKHGFQPWANLSVESQQRERGKHVPAPGLPTHFYRAENPLLPRATPRASLLAPVVNLLAHSTVRFHHLPRTSHPTSTRTPRLQRRGQAWRFAAGKTCTRDTHPSVTQVRGQNKQPCTQPCTCNPQLVRNASLQCTPSPVGLRGGRAHPWSAFQRKGISDSFSSPLPQLGLRTAHRHWPNRESTPDMSACHADG